MFDVNAMIDAADIEMILAELGIDINRRKSRRGWELYFNCINPNHDDTKKKMSMSDSGKYKGLFNCWSCKCHGNILQLIQYFRSCDFRESLLWLESKVGIGTLVGTKSLIYKLKSNKLNYGVDENEGQIPTYDLPSDYMPCYMGHPSTYDVEKYLQSRRISEESGRKFRVGVSSHHELGEGCLTIPIQFKGLTSSIFYAQPRDGGLKRYPSGSPQARILFNYDECVELDRYVLIESILDVLMLDSMNLGPAMCCFTNMLSEQQINLIKVFDDHAVFPDMDSERGWDLVNRMIIGLDKRVQLILPPAGKDPGDCTVNEVVNAFANMKRYCDWEVASYVAIAASSPAKIKNIKKR